MNKIDGLLKFDTPCSHKLTKMWCTRTEMQHFWVWSYVSHFFVGRSDAPRSMLRLRFGLSVTRETAGLSCFGTRFG